VRDTLRQLRPVTQLEFGLEAAVRELAAFWSRRNPQIRFELDIQLPMAPGRRQEEAAYRIVQESVSNAVRHGRPDLIRVLVQSDTERLALTVEDNGGGIQGGPDENISLGQAGIAGMRERVLALKGELKIVSVADRGVRLSATFPLARALEPA
jgi:two-component system sensor histidine kinase UhpB